MFLVRCLLFTILAFIPTYTSAASLHVIALMDTSASKIGSAVEVNLNTVLEESQRIAEYTGLDLHLYVFSHANAHHEFIDKIRDLSVTEEDVIFFIWSGHGFRSESKDLEHNPWPSFLFSHSDRAIDHLDITHFLLRKRARLVISIADTCNEYLLDEFAPPHYKKVLPCMPKQEAYKKLFLDYCGLIMAAGSVPGGYSYYLTPNGGGVFTQSWLTSLEVNARELGDSVRWEDVFETTTDLMGSINYCGLKPQEPMFELVVRLKSYID